MERDYYNAPEPDPVKEAARAKMLAKPPRVTHCIRGHSLVDPTNVIGLKARRCRQCAIMHRHNSEARIRERNAA